MVIKRILNKVKKEWAKTSSDRYIKYLRSKGITIGEDCEFFGIDELHIDITRPSLIEIGNNVRITRGVVLLTHGYEWAVLREIYGEIIGYAQPIRIKDNVFIGIYAKIMPGVNIGENSIIAAGSIVTKNVEPNSVVTGVPAKKIMSIDEYYKKRKEAYLNEAKEYAFSIFKNLKRIPKPEDFREFFPLFLERNTKKFGKIPVKYQTKKHFDKFMNSKPIYASFEDFLRDAGIQNS